MKAKRITISVYPMHEAGIREAANLIGINRDNYYRSPAVQYIIEDWLRRMEVDVLAQKTKAEAQK